MLDEETNFNSIWYDYKLKCMCLILLLSYFNSIWYDYKNAAGNGRRNERADFNSIWYDYKFHNV